MTATVRHRVAIRAIREVDVIDRALIAARSAEASFTLAGPLRATDSAIIARRRVAIGAARPVVMT